jgi:hypothetical protein
MIKRRQEKQNETQIFINTYWDCDSGDSFFRMRQHGQQFNCQCEHAECKQQYGGRR